MNSAIILAGYNNRKAVEKYSRIVEKDYGEHFIETGYKPLHEFTVEIDGVKVSKPLIRFTLEVLVADDLIEDIVIVGHRDQINDRLGEYLSTVKKRIVVIDQREHYRENLVSDFNIDLKETPTESVGGNLIKGYCASLAAEKRKPALFVASDSPLTTEEFINRFLTVSKEMMEETAILLPAVYTDPRRDKLGRVPLLLVNDTDVPIPAEKDKFGRNGFRLSSLIMADPHRFDVNGVNVIYSLRKALNPKIQMRIFRICREVGFPGIYNRYFLKKNLSIRQCEAICSAFFSGSFRVYPMHDIKATYDFDGTEKEFLEITKMLNKQKY